MNEYGKKVAKKMDEYMNNLDSVDREIRDIENAIEGYQVRGALAAGVKKAFEKSKIAEVKSDEAYDITQNLLDGSFDTSLLDTNFEERLNDAIENLQPDWTQFKDDTTSQLMDLVINAKYPPLPLQPIYLDGITDDTKRLQSILDYVGNNGGGTVFIPKGTLINSVNYIPNNVTLKGAGIGQTIIKMMDNCPDVTQRIPTGIYPKVRVDYFAVIDLTYDGNALNNVDLSTVSGNQFNDLFYAHGIGNSYVDANTDTSNPENNPDRSAKNFLIQTVHIKDTIRNSMLISGRAKDIGTVKDVIMENAFLDHFIYESYTDSLITYDNITFKGCWRGAAVCLETGKITNLRFVDIKPNPSPNYTLTCVYNSRDSYKTPENSNTRPIVKNAVVNVPFAQLEGIISPYIQSPKGWIMEDIVVNQTDNVENGIHGVPITFLIASISKNHTFRNLEFNNINQLNLLSLQPGSQNVDAENVKINYSDERNKKEDRLVSVTTTLLESNGWLNEPIKNIRVKGVTINKKASSMLRFRKSTEAIAKIENLTIEDAHLVNGEDITKEIFDILTNKTSFDIQNMRVINSSWSGYAALNIAVRDDMNLSIEKSLHNGIPTERTVKVTVNPGVTEYTFDFPYVNIDLSQINIRPYYNVERDNPPLARLAAHKMTLYFQKPTTAQQIYYVTGIL